MGLFLDEEKRFDDFKRLEDLKWRDEEEILPSFDKTLLLKDGKVYAQGKISYLPKK